MKQKVVPQIESLEEINSIDFGDSILEYQSARNRDWTILIDFMAEKIHKILADQAGRQAAPLPYQKRFLLIRFYDLINFEHQSETKGLKLPSGPVWGDNLSKAMLLNAFNLRKIQRGYKAEISFFDQYGFLSFSCINFEMKEILKCSEWSNTDLINFEKEVELFAG